jgi:hypothetical protein
MKLTINVLRNSERSNTLLHPPIVQLNDGMPQSRRCSAYELLEYLRLRADVSENEFNRGLREIEEKGLTVLESTKIVVADFERVLEPEEDLIRVLLREARSAVLPVGRS